jgi:predicted amidohydrolase
MKEVPRWVKVGLLQMGMEVEIEDNVYKAVKLIARAARQGAEIVCLPELFTTRYMAQYQGSCLALEEKCAYAETVPGRAVDALCKAAKANDVIVVGGSVYELDGDHLYNTSVVIDENGRMLGKYRKTHIPHDPYYYEQDYFEPGDTGFKVFDTSIGKVSVLICYDQWYPEAARCCALAGAELILYPTAIGHVADHDPKEGDWHRPWEDVMRGHAIANGVPVVGVNRVGIEDRMRFWGGSFVIDAFGKTQRRLGLKEQVSVVPVDLDYGREIRESWRFFHNRRPECYGMITQRAR